MCACARVCGSIAEFALANHIQPEQIGKRGCDHLVRGQGSGLGYCTGGGIK